jgi:hypothetical protein
MEGYIVDGRARIQNLFSAKARTNVFHLCLGSADSQQIQPTTSVCTSSFIVTQ